MSDSREALFGEPEEIVVAKITLAEKVLETWSTVWEEPHYFGKLVYRDTADYVAKHVDQRTAEEKLIEAVTAAIAMEHTEDIVLAVGTAVANYQRETEDA